MRFAS